MTEDFDRPRPRRRVPRRSAQLDLGAPAAAEKAGATHTGAETAPAAQGAPKPAAAANDTRDIGNWRFTPWKGRDMWTNPKTHETTFDKAEARKRRHQ